MVMSVSVMVAYATLTARSVASLRPVELSRPKLRLEDWSTTTWPGSRNPVSRQCPLVITSAGSLDTDEGIAMREPEQSSSATVPAYVTVTAAGAGACDGAAAAEAGPVRPSSAP